MSNAYCDSKDCEYYEDGCCEFEGMLTHDDCGYCTRFRYK